MKTINTVFNKYITKKYCVITIVILSLFTLSACDSKEEKDDIKVFTNFNAAVFEKNNNIYIFNEDDKYLTSVGDLKRLKEFTALSNNNEYIAFKYMDEDSLIQLYNTKTGEYSSLKIDIEEKENVSNVLWKDNKLVIEIYINPTTTKNLIYDIESNKLINSCEGTLIDILNHGETLIYGKNYQGNTSIYINEDVVYELKETREVLLQGAVDKEKKTISFITFFFDREAGEQREFLYEGKLEENKISKVERINKPYEIGGNIVFDSGITGIMGANSIYILHKKEFIKVKEEESNFYKNLQQLKTTLINTFKSEDLKGNLTIEEMGIFNITWFTK